MADETPKPTQAAVECMRGLESVIERRIAEYRETIRTTQIQMAANEEILRMVQYQRICIEAEASRNGAEEAPR